jgi:N-methylhydantoinase A/oxoprolinase/acetone carboxylase beta subunit
MVTLRVGVDIGGTFTDIAILGSDGSIHTKKVSSSTQTSAMIGCLLRSKAAAPDPG